LSLPQSSSVSRLTDGAARVLALYPVPRSAGVATVGRFTTTAGAGGRSRTRCAALKLKGRAKSAGGVLQRAIDVGVAYRDFVHSAAVRAFHFQRRLRCIPPSGLLPTPSPTLSWTDFATDRQARLTLAGGARQNISISKDLGAFRTIQCRTWHSPLDSAKRHPKSITRGARCSMGLILLRPATYQRGVQHDHRLCRSIRRTAKPAAGA
jgi:hypothetical protein